MEAEIGPMMRDRKAVGKRSLEWDLNDWNWDGDLLRASRLNPSTSDCRSRQLFPLVPQIAANGYMSSSCYTQGNNSNTEKQNGESDKRGKIVVVSDDDELDIEAGQLNFHLGEQVYPIAEVDVDKSKGRKGNKSKGNGVSQPVCQVEGCTADLSSAKDYHRRHKVCEVHSKVTEALVGSIRQRFCQQCSRFHDLQAFDEGKRSCRRRLAGHNKRRRKSQPETSANCVSLIDERSAGQLLISLLRLLSNMHTNSSDQSNDQDLLTQLLRNLAYSSKGSSISGLVQGSQVTRDVGTPNNMPDKETSRIQETALSVDAQRGLSTTENQGKIVKTASESQPRLSTIAGGTTLTKASILEASAERHLLGGIDLNNVYTDDLSDYSGHLEHGKGSVTRAYSTEQTLPSPPRNSGNSTSTSAPTSSSGSETQCYTDRIVFKLFGKDPSDIPHELRTQMLDWLSHSPSDIEGYIRPGCIVLTIYVCLNKSLWEEFFYDISCGLSRLLDMSTDSFWKTGWIYARIQQRLAFICDGQVVLDTLLPSNSFRSQISSISPLAVPAAETVQLVVKGSHLCGPTSRLLCAIEGRYLIQESCCSLLESTDTTAEQDEAQSLSFSCSIPNVVGRGFIEVEDYGHTGSFFPFIVAEPEVCSEICTLEREIDGLSKDESTCGQSSELNSKYRALDFIHEMGWLLHKSHLRFKLGAEPSLDLFPFERLKVLVEFAMDHNWRSVLRKLLDLLFSGTVNIGSHTSVEDALSDMHLLHIAVQSNNRLMVESLLAYTPKYVDSTLVLKQKQQDYESPNSMLFRPDVAGAGGLTPLHIAASSAGSEDVLDALLEDRGKVGIEAWKKARDSTGLTPSDYASLRGHYSYINLVQRKLDQRLAGKHVVLDISSLYNSKPKQMQSDKLKSIDFSSFYTEKDQISRSCKLCEQNVDYRFRGAAMAFRPAIISLVAIAVVCVCTALIFKSWPQICGVIGPFRWEAIKYGPM